MWSKSLCGIRIIRKVGVAMREDVRKPNQQNNEDMEEMIGVSSIIAQGYGTRYDPSFPTHAHGGLPEPATIWTPKIDARSE